jgi:hypothetical protein
MLKGIRDAKRDRDSNYMYDTLPLLLSLSVIGGPLQASITSTVPASLGEGGVSV